MNDYTEDFTNRTVNFMRKMVHRVGACTQMLTLVYMSGLYFQEESMHRDLVFYWVPLV